MPQTLSNKDAGAPAPVALPSEQSYSERIVSNKQNHSKLFASSENNFRTQKSNTKNKLSIALCENNFFFTPDELRDFFDKYEKLITVKSRREAYYFFLENKASTTAYTVNSMSGHPSGAYRAVSWLIKNGYIHAIRPLNTPRKGGPKPTLYGLPSLSEIEIAHATRKVMRSYSHSFSIVENLTQRIWDDYQDEEIQWNKIVSLARRNCEGFQFITIADLTAKELIHKHGAKIIGRRI